MSIEPSREFENKLGDAIASLDAASLNKIKANVEQLLNSKIPPEDRAYYHEALELINSTLIAFQIDVHKTVNPNKISEVNDKILNIAKQQTEVYLAIKKTFTDPGIAPYIERDRAQLNHIPYSEIYVSPVKNELVKMKQDFVDLLNNNDYIAQGKSEARQNLANKIDSVFESFNRFHALTVQHLWDQTPQEVKAKRTITQSNQAHHAPDSNRPLSSEPTKIQTTEKSYLQNVIFDDHSLTKNVPEAEFTEGRIYGDGNCGFSSLNTTREEVVEHLKEVADDPNARATVAPEIASWMLTTGRFENVEVSELTLQVDENIRAILDQINSLSGIRPKLELAGSTPEEILMDWDRAKSQLPEGNSFEKVQIPQESLIKLQESVRNRNEALAKMYSSKEIFNEYIEEYYVKQKGYLVLPDPGSTGVMNLIAEWKKAPIRVWKLDPETDTVYLRFQANVKNLAAETAAPQTLDIIHRNLHYNKLIPPTPLPAEIPLEAKKKFAGLTMY